MATLTEPLTYQTQCFWCGSNVFYHTNGNNDHVLFNKIGWPWDIHHCWTEHVDERNRNLRKIEVGLQRASFNGQKYSFAAQAWGRVEDEEVSGIGFVTDVKIDATPIAVKTEPNALPCCESIIKQGVYFYRLLFPFRYARYLKAYSIVKFKGKRVPLNETVYIWDPNVEVMLYPTEKAVSLASIAEQSARRPHPRNLGFI
jgi:hypothetical protein